MARRWTMETFLAMMEETHPNLEVLSKEYVNSRTKIKVRCKICGHVFEARSTTLKRGHGCPKCSGRVGKTTEEFIEEMKSVNENIIVLGEYTNNKGRILVKCKKCGYEWESTPNALLNQHGCPKCYGHMRRTTEQFQEELHKIFPHITVIGEYVNKETKIKCRCEICGHTFEKTPHVMLRHVGCPYCSKNSKRTKGEIAIHEWLIEHNIKHIDEYKIEGCADSRKLPFDFYLPEYNTLIEYDGVQHFRPVDFFGGQESFEMAKKHDQIKNEYCEEHGINLIRISYSEFENIGEILNAKLIS